MGNRVFLNKKGFIEQVYIGNQNFGSVMDAASELMLLCDKLPANRRKVRILVSVKKIGRISADALLAGAEGLNLMPDAKVAIFGGNKLVNDLVNLVTAAVGREKSVLVFDTKKEALGWLKKK